MTGSGAPRKPGLVPLAVGSAPYVRTNPENACISHQIGTSRQTVTSRHRILMGE